MRLHPTNAAVQANTAYAVNTSGNRTAERAPLASVSNRAIRAS